MSAIFTSTAVITIPSSISSSLPLPTQQAPFTYPTSFDTSLGTNFTNSSCPQFFKSFLADENFITCYPVSFYLLNSKSYVSIVRQGVASVETVLNASCSADYQQCSSLMANYSKALTQESNCLNDYNLENPLVTQAYNDFIAYDIVRNATCLQRNLTNKSTPLDRDADYCYTHALFDLNRTDDAYLYLLPLGIPYPSMNYPSCSNCTQAVMDIFYQFTGESQNPISFTYNSAAIQIFNESNCSSGFVPESAKQINTSSASKSAASTNDISRTLMLIILLTPFIMSILII